MHTCEIQMTEQQLWQETMSREHPLATSPGRNGQGDWHQRCSLFHLLSLSRPNQTLQHYRSRYEGACWKEIKTIMISNLRLKGCYRVHSVLTHNMVSWEEVMETGHMVTWSGNHSLRIESGRHCVPKLPECLRICQYCSSNQIENKNHFLFHCDRYKTIRQQITSDIVLKYPFFNLFNDTEKTIFLFNNADSFICKKLGYFIYEAFNIRETCHLI